MIKILIADDNHQITEVLKAFAQKENMDVDIASDGREVMEKYENNQYDILLLDICMPYIDGYEILKRIRKVSQVPIILITAKSEDYEKIMGLDYGADDYIVKPFSVAEVMARVRAILRRVESSSNNVEVYGLKLDLDKYQALIENQKLKLTKKEFEILYLLASNPTMVYSREMLLDKIWGYEYFGDSRTVDSHIKRLRAKLKEYDQVAIETIRGVGYKLVRGNEDKHNKE